MIENDEKTLLDCRKWLNFFDPNPEYKRHRRAQMKGTGLWIFNDPKVAQWLGLENGILCIQGNAGTFAGKLKLPTASPDI